MEEIADTFLNTSKTPVITAVITFLAYLVLAKLTDIFADRVLRKLSKKTATETDDRLIELIHRPVFITILIIGGIHSVRITNISENFIFYFNGILITLLTFIWASCIIKISNLLIGKYINKTADNTGLSIELIPLAENILKVVVFTGIVVIILSVWQINITPVLASAGIAGVAIALAAKDTLANFFGGVSVFVDKPYKIGDYIILDGGERGEVVKIGVRSTRIKTRDDILITIPNSIIANTKIINESAPSPAFRIRIPVGVAYGTDIDIVESMLLEIAGNNENIQKMPEPRVRFRAFGDSSLNLELLCWTAEPSVKGKTVHEINKAIYKKFNETGITIPFPHRTVYLREEKNWQ